MCAGKMTMSTSPAARRSNYHHQRPQRIQEVVAAAEVEVVMGEEGEDEDGEVAAADEAGCPAIINQPTVVGAAETTLHQQRRDKEEKLGAKASSKRIGR